MAFPAQDDIFDYSNEAIALRTLASLRDDPELRVRGEVCECSDGSAALQMLAKLQQDPELRPIVLDALWASTRERALFLFNRLCCVTNAPRIREAMAELERLTAIGEFLSTSRTPAQELTDCLTRMLGAMGTELATRPAPDRPQRSAAEEPWEYHEVIADMRASRLAGTGKGGERLTPIEDGIRRLKVILIASDDLNAEKNGGAPVHISGDLGRAEVLAIRSYVDRVLGDPA